MTSIPPGAEQSPSSKRYECLVIDTNEDSLEVVPNGKGVMKLNGLESKSYYWTHQMSQSTTDWPRG